MQVKNLAVAAELCKPSRTDDSPFNNKCERGNSRSARERARAPRESRPCFNNVLFQSVADTGDALLTDICVFFSDDGQRRQMGHRHIPVGRDQQPQTADGNDVYAF